MPMTEGAFEGVGGVKIFTREWQPAGEPHGVVVISHGFNSPSGQYEWVAQQLASKGLAVYALDHRGRGKSDGERFFVERFSDYTSDLATFIDIVKARAPGAARVPARSQRGRRDFMRLRPRAPGRARGADLRELRLPGAG